MKKLILILGIALVPSSSYGTLHDSQLADVHKWLLHIQEDPRQAAKALGEWWFAVAQLADWNEHFKIESVALELVAYYAELEKALVDNADLPLHEQQHVHDRFFHEKIKPDTYRRYFEDYGWRADEFARALFKNLFEREDAAYLLEEQKLKGRGTIVRKPTAAKLVAQLLRTGREFWFKHALTEVIRRRPPVTEELRMYARALPDLGYEKFLNAIMDHHFDFGGSQPVIEEVVSTRVDNLQDVPKTGDGRCDLMLAIALHNHSQ